MRSLSLFAQPASTFSRNISNAAHLGGTERENLVPSSITTYDLLTMSHVLYCCALLLSYNSCLAERT